MKACEICGSATDYECFQKDQSDGHITGHGWNADPDPLLDFCAGGLMYVGTFMAIFAICKSCGIF